jgi:uncharacterized membrane protein YcaP (DUF421 family)
MLFGDAPPGFLPEVFFRGPGLYLFMLLVVRRLGKRMAGKLMEMVLMVTLGRSVAVVMQVPEGGVLMGFVVLTVEKTEVQVCAACKHNEWVEAVF